MDRTRHEELTNEGISALHAGDAVTARARFQELVPTPYMLLAQACRRLNDVDGEEAALTGQLADDIRHLPALLAMADLKLRRADDRAATSFFRAAIAQAAIAPAPPRLVPLLERAQVWLAQTSKAFEGHLRDSLKAAGFTGKPARSIGEWRLGQAIDLLTGKTALFLQQPSMLYYPGLSQRAFFERDEFPWLVAMEAASSAMEAELRSVLADGHDFRPYIETPVGRPAPNNPLRDDPAWGAHYFWKNGVQIAENASKSPVTMAALALAPMPKIGERSPMALWSSLKACTHIAPHHGMLNTRLICHIPLIVPPHCALRVGSETRAWEHGKALIFDDSFEHEAWNRSDAIRVILLFEIWRPDISEEERAALTHLFETIDRFGTEEAELGG